MKVKFIFEADTSGSRDERIEEVPDDTTSEELDEMSRNFMEEHVYYDYEIVE